MRSSWRRRCRSDKLFSARWVLKRPLRRPPRRCCKRRRLDLKNFSLVASHKCVLPAMMALLEAGDVHVDGFLCPGHVSAIIGVEVYRPIVEKYHLPCVVSGFEEIHMAGAITRLVELIRDGKAELINEYAEAVLASGNRNACLLLEKVFETADVRLAGLGDNSAVGPGSAGGIPPIRRAEAVQPEDAGGSRAGRLLVRQSHYRGRDALRMQAVRQGVHADQSDRPVHGQFGGHLPGVLQVCPDQRGGRPLERQFRGS